MRKEATSPEYFDHSSLCDMQEIALQFPHAQDTNFYFDDKKEVPIDPYSKLPSYLAYTAFFLSHRALSCLIKNDFRFDAEPSYKNFISDLKSSAIDIRRAIRKKITQDLGAHRTIFYKEPDLKKLFSHAPQIYFSIVLADALATDLNQRESSRRLQLRAGFLGQLQKESKDYFVQKEILIKKLNEKTEWQKKLMAYKKRLEFFEAHIIRVYDQHSDSVRTAFQRLPNLTKLKGKKNIGYINGMRRRELEFATSLNQEIALLDVLILTCEYIKNKKYPLFSVHIYQEYFLYLKPGWESLLPEDKYYYPKNGAEGFNVCTDVFSNLINELMPPKKELYPSFFCFISPDVKALIAQLNAVHFFLFNLNGVLRKNKSDHLLPFLKLIVDLQEEHIPKLVESLITTFPDENSGSLLLSCRVVDKAFEQLLAVPKELVDLQFHAKLDLATHYLDELRINYLFLDSQFIEAHIVGAPKPMR